MKNVCLTENTGLGMCMTFARRSFRKCIKLKEKKKEKYMYNRRSFLKLHEISSMRIIIKYILKILIQTRHHSTDTYKVTKSTTINRTRVELASLVGKSIVLSVSPTYHYPLPRVCAIFARKIFSLHSRLNRYYQSGSFRPS